MGKSGGCEHALLAFSVLARLARPGLHFNHAVPEAVARSPFIVVTVTAIF